MTNLWRPFWNVRACGAAPYQVESTTLGAEIDARRFATGRGFLVSAPDAQSAIGIVSRWILQSRGYDLPDDRRVQRHEHPRGVIILMGAPSF